MKKIIMMLLMVMLLTGCGSDVYTGSDNVDGESIKVDLDVSAMSEIMAYSTLENIMYNPKEFIGKTVKIRGSFYYEYYKELDTKFYAILLMDETNCCQAFAEIEMKDGIEFPQVGQDFMIIGEVKIKTIDGNEYAYVDVMERVM